MAFSQARHVACFLGRNITVNVRQFSLASQQLYSSTVDEKFEGAKEQLDSLTNDPGNETKLKMYALFKQATIGKNTTDKPGASNFVGQAKWSAWNELGDMSQDDAKQAYVDIVNDLKAAEGK